MHAIAVPRGRSGSARRFQVLREFAAGMLAEALYAAVIAAACAALVELAQLAGG